MTEIQIDPRNARLGKINRRMNRWLKQPAAFRRDMTLAQVMKSICVSVVTLFVMWAGSVSISAQSVSGMELPTPRIVKQIDNTDLISLKGNVPPWADAKSDLGVAPDDLPLKRMMLVLKPSDSQQTALKGFLDAQQNPNSSNFHHWLTPSQFGMQYGVAQQDIDQVLGWLKSNGFSIEPVSGGHNVITFSGSHAQFKSAFHAEIHSYRVNGKQHFASATNPQIPTALAPVVVGIASLHDMAPKAQHVEGGTFAKNQQGAGWQHVSVPPGHEQTIKPLLDVTESNGNIAYVMGPYDFATMYNVKPLWDAGLDGTGQTLALVSDSDIKPGDVDSFRASFGLPAKKLNIIYDGPNPGRNGDEGEADLDVQWSGGIAKGATIDLVVAANTNTTAGVDLAAEYIIDKNLAPVMSVSYGTCEYLLGNAGNTFQEALYQQAAAQGITVMVAAGDSSSDTCDDGLPVAEDGFSVNGLGSTSYNVSVGGTDLSGNYSQLASHWSTTTNSTTLQSLTSYVPETPWNETCGNTFLLTILPSLISDGYLSAKDKTLEDICNDSNVINSLGWDSLVGGGGGPSNCTYFDGTTYPTGCTGRAKPTWQSQVLGIPNDKVRDLPDVSLFAGSGFWDSFYAYCESDLLMDGTCNPVTSIEGAGGTSFASPIFAGIVAILNQKTQGQQGNANYVLYKLAAAEYSNPNQLAACASGSITTGNSCVFYDMTQGSNSPACINGSIDCPLQIPTHTYGVMSGWNATPGYDTASGLGSVNAYNLVNSWSAAAATFSSSLVSLSAPANTIYGSSISASIVVTAATGNGTPSGDVAVLYDSSTSSGLGAASPFTLAAGKAVGTVNGLSVGTHTLVARYGGDAVFASSTSIAVPIVITVANTQSNLIPSRTSLVYGESLSLTAAIATASTALSPTGTTTFTDTTTGLILGTASVSPEIDPNTGYSFGTAFLNIPASALISGTNTIMASYSGDGNYKGSQTSAVSVSNAGPFAISISPGSLYVAASNPAASPATITVTPSGGYALAAPALTFACQSPVPGVSCLFSAPVASGSNVQSTLTVQLAAPLLIGRSSGFHVGSMNPTELAGIGSIAMLVFWLVGDGKRRRLRLLAGLLLIGTAPFYIGCQGGSPADRTPGAVSTGTTLTSSASTPIMAAPVTFQAKAAQLQGAGIPTGTITFTNGATALASVPLANGAATYTTSSLPLGIHSVAAQYSGDGNDFASTSPAATVDVTLSTVLTIVISDHNGNSSTALLPLSIQ